MDAQIDHTTGLFMLRESSGPLTIHSTKEVRGDLSAGIPLNVLDFYCKVNWVEIDLHNTSETKISEVEGITLNFMPKARRLHFLLRGKPRPGDTLVFKLLTKIREKSFYAPRLGSLRNI